MSNEEIALAIQSGDNFFLQQLWEQCKGFIRKEACRWARARRLRFNLCKQTRVVLPE